MLPIYTTDNIIDFLKDYSGNEEINADTDIFRDLGMDGDDFHEMMDAYAKKYNVDMSSYLWYFHGNEEGGKNSLGSVFFKPPYERVERIPLTPSLLTEFANNGSWSIDYPEHTLPKRRYDTMINFIALCLVVVWGVIWAVNKYLL